MRQVLPRREINHHGSREFSDYVLLGKNGKPLAVVEAKKSSTNAELGSRAGETILSQHPGGEWRRPAFLLLHQWP